MFVVIHLSIAMNLIIKHGILHCTLIKLRQVITFCLLRLKFGLVAAFQLPSGHDCAHNSAEKLITRSNTYSD